MNAFPENEPFSVNRAFGFKFSWEKENNDSAKQRNSRSESFVFNKVESFHSISSRCVVDSSSQQGMVRLLERLDLVDENPKSHRQRHSVSATEFATIQLETIANLANKKPAAVASKPPEKRRSSIGIFAAGLSIGSGLIVDDYDVQVIHNERRVTSPPCKLFISQNGTFC